jgi:hypothetical protein
MSNISKIINDSITSVVNEGVVDKIKEKAKEVIDDMGSGKAAEIVYDKLHPEKTDIGYEMAKKLAKMRQAQEDMPASEHLAKAGKKAVAAAKEKGEEAIQAIKDHPGIAAATAAGLAAAVGGLAAVKRMRKAAKK